MENVWHEKSVHGFQKVFFFVQNWASLNSLVLWLLELPVNSSTESCLLEKMTGKENRDLRSKAHDRWPWSFGDMVRVGKLARRKEQSSTAVLTNPNEPTNHMIASLDFCWFLLKIFVFQDVYTVGQSEKDRIYQI